MKVELNFRHRKLIATRTSDDLRFRNESHFWYGIKKALLALGCDVVKKRMWKDGHMVNNNIHYVRERKGEWCVWDADYALRLLHEVFRKQGSVQLRLEKL